MDITGLKHNPAACAKAWHEPKDSTLIIAKESCKVYFPKHYIGSDLGYIDDKFNVIGIFGVVVGNNYCASNALAIMPFTPAAVNLVRIDEGQYYELSWEKGDIICPNRNLVKAVSNLAKVYAEAVEKGKTAWYIRKEQMINLFDTDNFHTGGNVGDNRSQHALITAFRAKDPRDRSVPFRLAYTTQKEFDEAEPDYVALNSVAASRTNTMTKLTSGYLPVGVVGAIVEPTKTVESVEGHLLK